MWCKSNPTVFQGTEMGYSSMTKIVSWYQPNREAFSFTEDKTERETQTSKLKVAALKGQQSMTSCSHWLQTIFIQGLKSLYLEHKYISFSSYFWTSENEVQCIKLVILFCKTSWIKAHNHNVSVQRQNYKKKSFCPTNDGSNCISVLTHTYQQFSSY